MNVSRCKVVPARISKLPRLHSIVARLNAVRSSGLPEPCEMHYKWRCSSPKRTTPKSETDIKILCCPLYIMSKFNLVMQSKIVQRSGKSVIIMHVSLKGGI